MPIDVKIEMVPHGDDALRHQIGEVRIRQVEKLDTDSDGWRIYEVIGARVTTVRHRRGDGAGVLVAKAIASQWDIIPSEAAS